MQDALYVLSKFSYYYYYYHRNYCDVEGFCPSLIASVKSRLGSVKVGKGSDRRLVDSFSQQQCKLALHKIRRLLE